MEFFDCNCFLGLPAKGMLRPVRTADDLLAAMDRSGIGRGLVWHVAQRDYCVPVGNALLADAVAGHRDRLTGCWSILPNQAGELPEPGEFLRQMTDTGADALRIFPEAHKFLLRKESFGPILEHVVGRRIPLMLSLSGAVTWDNVYDLLADFPELVCVLCDVGSWGPDRLFRPLIERYPNVHVEIGDYFLDGGIQAIVETYGPKRLLFGTGFPVKCHGGMMLTLKHAEITDTNRQDIACGNMIRILEQVKL